MWSFTTGLAGKTLGQAAGAVVARTSPKATWPDGDAPLDGVIELQIGNLGVWGPWLPPGWRLSGEMHASASFGGRFGAPEYVGELTGKGLAVRNVLQGVDVRDGDVSIVLLGDTARIERFSANAGTGSLNLQGNASLGETPRAELGLRLDKFQLLGRVDRRIVASGDARAEAGPRHAGAGRRLQGRRGPDRLQPQRRAAACPTTCTCAAARPPRTTSA